MHRRIKLGTIIIIFKGYISFELFFFGSQKESTRFALLHINSLLITCSHKFEHVIFLTLKFKRKILILKLTPIFIKINNLCFIIIIIILTKNYHNSICLESQLSKHISINKRLCYNIITTI